MLIKTLIALKMLRLAQVCAASAATGALAFAAGAAASRLAASRQCCDPSQKHAPGQPPDSAPPAA